jgi:DNA-binding response OmpR family regulator
MPVNRDRRYDQAGIAEKSAETSVYLRKLFWLVVLMATVLILDDEQSLLRMIAIYLKNSGHSILQCASADSACEQFKDIDGAVDLVVADGSLGNVSGVEIGLELKTQTPKLKLLFISGYPFNGWSIRDAALLLKLPPDSVRVLQKPFSALDLLIKVDELIGQLPKSASTSGVARTA